jgi:transcriptional regulator with XRE-family HTH domain
MFMELDYFEIGKRIARRRKDLGLKQTEVCERAGINDKYLSCIERATSSHHWMWSCDFHLL